MDSAETSPQDSLRMLYEDEALLAVAKPSGMVTHPAYRRPDGTLTDAVFARAAARGEGRPWLLHRLDRDTSGVVLFAKMEAARRALVRQFERHTIRKQYLALVAGVLIPPTGEIDAPLKRDPLDRRRVVVAADGQPALTRYRVLGTSFTAPSESHASSALAGQPTASVSLALAEPVTGRTHQIRAHLAERGAPILGDATYHGPLEVAGAVVPRVMLHAWRLICRYPRTPTAAASVTLHTPVAQDAPPAPFVVTAPIPPDMLALIGQLGLADALATLDAV